MPVEMKCNAYDIEELRRIVEMDSHGNFTWKVDRSSKIKAGMPAGGKHSSGYRVISYNGGHIQAHRLVWAFVHGAWPDSPIDHVNCIRSDNRPENLRKASSSQNAINSPQPKASGLPRGVCFCKSTGRYRAAIKVLRKVTWLGRFDTVEQAANAYAEAARKLHGEFIHKDAIA